RFTTDMEARASNRSNEFGAVDPFPDIGTTDPPVLPGAGWTGQWGCAVLRELCHWPVSETRPAFQPIAAPLTWKHNLSLGCFCLCHLVGSPKPVTFIIHPWCVLCTRSMRARPL